MKNHNRRDFIKQVSATGAVLATGAFVSCAEKASASCSGAGTEENIQSKLIIPTAQGLKISGTFLAEISHDIPHQNWGEKEDVYKRQMVARSSALLRRRVRSH